MSTLRAQLLATLAVAFVASGAAATPPAEDYLLHCAGCHGLEGLGSSVVPGLRELAPLLDASGGRAYIARIPGVAQAPLDDARLARLLDWVLSELSGRRPEPSFSAAELGPLRREPLRDPFAVRPLPFASP